MIVDDDSAISSCRVSMCVLAAVCNFSTLVAVCMNLWWISRALTSSSSSILFSVATSDVKRLTSLFFSTASGMVGTSVFHSALSFVIVVLSELMMVLKSKSDETNVKVAMIVYFAGKFVRRPVYWFASVGFDVNSMVSKRNM